MLKLTSNVFDVLKCRLRWRNFFLTLVYYFAGILEKIIAAADKHDLSIKRLGKAATTGNSKLCLSGFQEKAINSSWTFSWLLGKYFYLSAFRLKNETIEQFSFASWEPFLWSLSIVHKSNNPYLYSIFTLEPLRDHLFKNIQIEKALHDSALDLKLSFEKSKMLKEESANFRFSQNLRDWSMKIPFFEFLNYYIMTGVKVSFHEYYCYPQLDGIFMPPVLRGMIEGKDYRDLNIVFTLVLGFWH